MRTVTGLEALKGLGGGSVLSIGNFDGLHLGHRKILSRASELAAEVGAEVAVVTFEPHPFTILRPADAPPRLTEPAAKRELLSKAGVDVLIELPPVPEILGMTAEEFWSILREEVRPRALVEGSTFTFGRGRGGTLEKLRQWAPGSGIELEIVEGVEAVLCDLTVVAVSSSIARWLIGHGRMRDAATCLGRPHLLEGVVVRGFQRGRTIGVPTANLRLPATLVRPPDGVYAGACRARGKRYPVAVSIGTMPTFGEGLGHQVEAHLVGFEGDLYGQTLQVEVIDHLREQRKYRDLAVLKEQIGRDVEEAEERFGRLGVPA